MTLALGCVSILIAMLTGLLLNHPLPALPFIALSFLLTNLDPLVTFLLKNANIPAAAYTSISNVKIY